MNYPIFVSFYAEQALNFSVFGLAVLLRLHHFKLIFPKKFRWAPPPPLAPGQGRCPWSESLGGSAASLARGRVFRMNRLLHIFSQYLNTKLLSRHVP